MNQGNEQPIAASQKGNISNPNQNLDQKNLSLDKKVINYFKNFEIKPTKGKIISLTIITSTLILAYTGLILLERKPAPQPQLPKTETVIQETTQATRSAEFQQLEQKVGEFNARLDKLENFRANFSPPNPDLNLNFK